MAGASYPKITGYEPGSDVISHNMIDLDQKELEEHLKVNDYTKASAIYNKGANSGAHAVFTVSALATELAKGTQVTQGDKSGTVKSTATAGSTSFKVSYTSTCKEGGTSSPEKGGCFNADGTLTIGQGDTAVTVDYTGVENKYRTLAGFSTGAESKMGDGSQLAYNRAKAFWDTVAGIEGKKYGHDFVTHALSGTGPFANTGNKGRGEGVKKGSAYMNVWLYTIREFEDAIDDCEKGCTTCNLDGVHAWDEGVAFYTGSLEGTAAGGSDDGKLLYRLAQKRCGNFGTCDASGLSAVNKRLFEIFPLARDKLVAGDCALVKPIRDEAIKLMSIPLIQGALRYAYIVANQPFNEKARAEGAAFSGAILGMVHHCNSGKAALIYKNMAMDSAAPMVDKFQAVKEAFESVYSCMGITCNDIGGILAADGTYKAGAEPCADVGAASEAAPTPPSTEDSDNSAGSRPATSASNSGDGEDASSRPATSASNSGDGEDAGSRPATSASNSGDGEDGTMMTAILIICAVVGAALGAGAIGIVAIRRNNKNSKQPAPQAQQQPIVGDGVVIGVPMEAGAAAAGVANKETTSSGTPVQVADTSSGGAKGSEE
jgi:hypothetical protein